MQRTGLSIAGGVLLLLASVGTGIGGVVWSVMGNAEALMAMSRKQFEAAEKSGKLTPEQKQQIEAARAKIDETEADLTANPEKRAKLAKLRSYGYFEAFAALVGVIAAIGVLVASGFGKAAGAVAAVLGAATGIWGCTVGTPVPPPALQIAFVVAYGVAFAGALSLKRELPTTV